MGFAETLLIMVAMGCTTAIVLSRNALRSARDRTVNARIEQATQLELVQLRTRIDAIEHAITGDDPVLAARITILQGRRTSTC